MQQLALASVSSLAKTWQRVRKRQPLGGLAGLGTSPVMMIRCRCRSLPGSGIGTALISAWVYGCDGRSKSVVAVGHLDDGAEVHDGHWSAMWRTTDRSWAMNR